MPEAAITGFFSLRFPILTSKFGFIVYQRLVIRKPYTVNPIRPLQLLDDFAHFKNRTVHLVEMEQILPALLGVLHHGAEFVQRKAPAVETYTTGGVHLEGTLSDSARAFEYLRDKLITHLQSPSPPAPTLFDALRQSTEDLINEYPGEYNYLLTNGSVLFAFTNHRQFMLLKGSKKLEGGLLLTTLQRGVSDEHWERLAKSTNKQGLLLMIAGTDIILQQAID